MIAEIAIDLDQVLADMIRATMDLYGISYEPGDKWLDVKDWDGISVALNQRKNIPLGSSAAITEEELWGRVGEQGAAWWARFHKLPHADLLVKTAINKVGELNVFLLTAPMSRCLGPCVQGKYEWVSKHYPKLLKRIVYADEKFRAAAPYRLLVDDGVHNITAWTWAGGPAMLWPACWNPLAGMAAADALLHLSSMR